MKTFLLPENGDFYASQGPLIEELYVEDDIVHLKCSPAKYVAMNTEHRSFGGFVRQGRERA